MSVTEERIQELDRSFLEFMSKTENIEAATKEIYEDLLDEVFMGFVFDVHRTIKTGSSDVEEGIPDEESYAIVDSPGLDVFGQHPVKKSQECNCPNCDRGVAACRFATHLEKCMGMGRNSSRIASRRIANSSKDMSNFRRDKRRRRRRRLEPLDRQAKTTQGSKRDKKIEATEEQSAKRRHGRRKRAHEQREFTVELREHVDRGQASFAHANLRRHIGAHEEALHALDALSSAHRGSAERDAGPSGNDGRTRESGQRPSGRRRLRRERRSKFAGGSRSLGSRRFESF